MGALLTPLVSLELVKGVMGIGAADRPLYTRGKGNCEANQEVFLERSHKTKSLSYSPEMIFRIKTTAYMEGLKQHKEEQGEQE